MYQKRTVKVLILLSFAFLFNLSCVSINIELEPSTKQQPSFTYYSHYGLFGLIGSDSLDAKQICIDSNPVRIKNYFSFEDLLFAVTTLGLYTPKSTKVWCESTNQESSIQL